MGLRDLLLKRGIFFKWSFGKMFDPRNQKRTDAVKDIMKKQNKKLDDKIKEWFDGHFPMDNG